MFNVVYSAKDKIKNGIAQGTIPNESFIITNDSVVPESFYYDENSNLKQITKRLSFNSLAEARKWVNKYEYKGEFISVLRFLIRKKLFLMMTLLSLMVDQWNN